MTKYHCKLDPEEKIRLQSWSCERPDMSALFSELRVNFGSMGKFQSTEWWWITFRTCIYTDWMKVYGPSTRSTFAKFSFLIIIKFSNRFNFHFASVMSANGFSVAEFCVKRFLDSGFKDFCSILDGFWIVKGVVT